MSTATTPLPGLWLDVLRARRMYRADPRSRIDGLQEVWARFAQYGESLRQQLAQAGIATRVDHAYTPNEQGHYGGAEHLVVLADLDSGRLHRKAGDALCKPAAAFWGLEHTHGGPATCKTCVEQAERVVARAGRPVTFSREEVR